MSFSEPNASTVSFPVNCFKRSKFGPFLPAPQAAIRVARRDSGSYALVYPPLVTIGQSKGGSPTSRTVGTQNHYTVGEVVLKGVTPHCATRFGLLKAGPLGPANVEEGHFLAQAVSSAKHSALPLQLIVNNSSLGASDVTQRLQIGFVQW